MRNLKLAIAVASVLVGAQAMASGENKLENCRKIAKISESIMDSRQKGVPAERVYQVFSREENPKAKDAYMAMVTSAYQVPRFNTEENKRSAVADFKDKTLVTCMR